jgi:DNA (cytosine-5)-methyltransferase 1
MRAVELFAGAGGLGMGISLAGFKSEAVVEWDKWACDTVRENVNRGYPPVAGWDVFEGDVREWIMDFSCAPRSDGIDLVAGGPPCQPFSMGGKHRAFLDSRDMFPATVNIIRTLRPRAFIVENVKGLTRPTFHNYYQYIQSQLRLPSLPARPDESWLDHHHRLQQALSSPLPSGQLAYNLIPTLVNAANYGIPQRRERVFMVGFRNDLDSKWQFPDETHSFEALLHTQWVTGEYWERHRVAKAKRPPIPEAHRSTIERMRALGLTPSKLPWRTVRDAIVNLPDPEKARTSKPQNHKFQPGAKTYPGHTGSPLDLPAKTLKAGDHGVPGGENMLVRPDGSVRYFTVREAARLQTFPDGYVFHGAWSETMRQLGNAVPVALARIVAASVAEKLVGASIREELAQIPERITE